MRGIKLFALAALLLLPVALLADAAREAAPAAEAKAKEGRAEAPAGSSQAGPSTAESEGEAKGHTGSLGLCRYSCLSFGSGSFNLTPYSFYTTYSDCCDGGNLCPVGENAVGLSWNAQRCLP